MSNERIARLRAFIEKDPADPFPRYALALEMDSAGDTPGAVKALEDLLTRSPRYVPTYQHLGTLYKKTGSLEQTRKILTAGILVARGEGDLHAAGEMSEALEELDE